MVSAYNERSNGDGSDARYPNKSVLEDDEIVDDGVDDDDVEEDDVNADADADADDEDFLAFFMICKCLYSNERMRGV